MLAMARGIRPSSRSGTHHRFGVFHFGRRGKILSDQPAPGLEILRASEIDRVVFQRIPFGKQPVTRWLFDRSVKLDAPAAFGAQKQRPRFGDRGLKVLLGAGFDVDLGDFGDHDLAPLVLVPVLSPAAPKEKGAPRRPFANPFWVDLAQQQHGPRNHHRATHKHGNWPAAVARIVAALRAALDDQSRLVLFRGPKHASKAASRGDGSRLKRAQRSLEITSTERFHGEDDRDRMVNSGLPSAQALRGITDSERTVLSFFRWRFSSDLGISSAASTRLRPPRLA